MIKFREPGICTRYKGILVIFQKGYERHNMRIVYAIIEIRKIGLQIEESTRTKK